MSKKVASETQLTGTILFRTFFIHLKHSTYNYHLLLVITVAALEFLLSNPTDPLDVKKFNEFCGVGVVVTPEQIKSIVR